MYTTQRRHCWGQIHIIVFVLVLVTFLMMLHPSFPPLSMSPVTMLFISAAFVFFKCVIASSISYRNMTYMCSFHELLLNSMSTLSCVLYILMYAYFCVSLFHYGIVLRCSILFKNNILIQLLFRFAKGPSSLGLFAEVQRHDEMMKVLLVNQNVALDANTMELTIQGPVSRNFR